MVTSQHEQRAPQPLLQNSEKGQANHKPTSHVKIFFFAYTKRLLKKYFQFLYKIFFILHLTCSRETHNWLFPCLLQHLKQLRLSSLIWRPSMTKNPQQSMCLVDLCVCLWVTSPLWLFHSLLPDIIILFSASPCLETRPFLPNSWIVSHNAQQPPNPSITHAL